MVFELAGTARPAGRWSTSTPPSSQGRGDAVDVPGAAQLQVTLQGTTNPYETDAAELPAGRWRSPAPTWCRASSTTPTFEGTSVAWVGTTGRAPFRVYSLTGPSRVVVEVASAG